MGEQPIVWARNLVAWIPYLPDGVGHRVLERYPQELTLSWSIPSPIRDFVSKTKQAAGLTLATFGGSYGHG